MTVAASDAAASRAPSAEAMAHVNAVVAASSTSFLSGMRALPRPRREAMFAVYAFCREVDDIADEPAPLSEKLQGLADWRQEIEALFAGAPSRLTSQALVQPIARYHLPKAEFLAVIDGMEMDARGPIVAPDLETLLLYCRRVAGAVGQLSIRCFGAQGPQAEALAVTLGEGLQLTNILRDLTEDAADGRLYLPLEALEAAGVTAREPAAVLADPKRPEASQWLAKRARAKLEESRRIIAALPRRQVRPALLMLAVYEKILDRLEARGWEVLEPRVKLSKLTKLQVLLRHGLF
ncbi:MAG: presqualene diphosphate synthase HpnD [Pseudomonadota bacterium]